GRTPLWFAAANEREAIIQLLLKNGADINMKDEKGRTPISYAAENGREAIAQLLLKNGADIDMYR
ncbi:ankyrin repeat-containing domain protein, partial [Thelonectria olida]